MAEYRGSTFSGAKVVVTGNRYVDCTFENAVLEFDGTAGVEFDTCKFIQPRFHFTGPAATTFQFLQGINATKGGAAIIDKAFPITIESS